MNEQTAKLLDELAAKLQVTSAHLREVLVAQAYVSSVTSLAVFVAMLIVAYALVKYYKSLEILDDGHIVLFGFATVLYFFYIFGFLLSLDIIVSGFVNPEYVALKEVLTVLK
jgi:hypothetical protein